MALRFSIDRRAPGRALLVEEDGTLYASRSGRIQRTRDAGAHWEEVARLPRSWLRRCVEPSRLASRLLRHEVRALARLPETRGWVAANRQGVFHGRGGELRASAVSSGDLPLMPPMTLSLGPEARVLFGEYGIPDDPRAVRLFVSEDAGATFEEFHRFAAGDVYHVHNLVFDPLHDHYWVFVGDWGEQAGIGRLSRDLQRFEWLGRGSQQLRAVAPLDLGDRLVYGTDTELESNAIVTLDKATGKVERLAETDGSCIHACRFGDVFALTTTVEPSRVNRTRDAVLWVSRDAERWERVFEASKDVWPGFYFQFGSLVLPRGASAQPWIAFSGQAVRGLDGQLAFGVVSESAAGDR